MGCDAVMSVSAISSQMASSGMGCLVPAVSGGFGGGGGWDRTRVGLWPRGSGGGGLRWLRPKEGSMRCGWGKESVKSKTVQVSGGKLIEC